MITSHQLTAEAFAALARADGDVAVVTQLRGVQHSKHLMLLHAIAEEAGGAEAGGADAASPGAAAFRAAYRVLATVQQASPATFAWLFGLPHIAGWTHDCIARMNRGRAPDLGYLASAAAAAAVRAGVPFELDVPVSGGRALLPGLGYFHGIGSHDSGSHDSGSQDSDGDGWIRLRGDGERVAVGALTEARYADVTPDDGAREPVPHWQGTPAVRAMAGGRTWQTLLETTDRYLDQYMLPMSALAGGQVTSWRDRIQGAWEVLVRHHGWAAGQLAEGVSVIVPLTARSEADLESATSPAAFGAIATCWPPDPVIMAETLVHEFQHLKLCGLLDMVRLMEPCEERVYAPWRPDPRPAAGLLQGVYAHLGVACFWNAQRHAETEPDEILRAQVMFERWRSTIDPAIATLLRTGCLTPAGIRFAGLLRDQGRLLAAETVPARARDLAREVALDHWLTWQLRHSAVDAAAVAELAAAYQRGEPLASRALPAARIEEETRKASPGARSRLLSMRYLEPRRSAEDSAAAVPGLSEADFLLLSGHAATAVQAYRAEISTASEPLPDAWTGLALAIHLLAQTPLLPAFATCLPLMFEVHARLSGRGVRSDPLELAAWFA